MRVILRFPVCAAELSQPGCVVEGADFCWDQGGDGLPGFLFGSITILACGHGVPVVMQSTLSHSKQCEF